MAPPVPDKIECTTSAAFTPQLRAIQAILGQPETEDNWEQLGRAIQTLAALAKGGAYKLDPDYVDGIKSLYKPITTSMLSERTRLSSTATDLVTAIAPRLASRFEVLVPLIVPAVIKLCNRPNKVFVTRAQKCLTAIIEHCHALNIIPFLREAVKEKAQSIRLSAIQATLLVFVHWDPHILEVKEGSAPLNRYKGNVEDMESIIRDTARDANPEVRKISREVFEKYCEVFTDRVTTFTAPLSPTIRRYLAISGDAKSGPSRSRPAPKPAAKLAVPEPPVAGPSRTQKVDEEDDAPKSKLPTRPVPHRAIKAAPVGLSNGPGPSAPPPASFTRAGRVASATLPQRHGHASRLPPKDVEVASEGAPSRPPSRLHQAPSSSGQNDEQVQQQGPTRPLNIVKTSRPAPSSAPPSSTSSTFSNAPIRAGIQSKASAESTSRGPVRPQMTARAVTVQDPPFRPMRKEKPPPIKKPEPIRIESVKVEPAKTQPVETEPAKTELSKSEVLVQVEVEEATPNVEEPAQEPEEVVDVSSPPATVVELPVQEPVSTPSVAEESLASSTSSAKPLTPTEDSVRRPASAASSVSATATSTPSANIPAFLAKRLEAKTKAAALPGGFAPKRRRPGLTEPTLSQLAKQKPSKPFVPQDKKTEPSKATKQPPPAPSKKTAATKTSDKTAPKSEQVSRKPSPAPLPTDVAVAMLVPLPMIAPDEVPLPPVEPDEVPLPAPAVENELELDIDYLSELTKTPAPVTPKLPRQSTCLIDFNTSIVVGGAEETPRAPVVAGVPNFVGNFLDFDISVVMPESQSTLLPVPPSSNSAQTPFHQHHPFSVLQDMNVDEFKTPIAPVRYLRPQSRLGKDEVMKDVEEKRRIALGEKELNVRVPLRS